jgi:hypothetical protein
MSIHDQRPSGIAAARRVGVLLLILVGVWYTIVLVSFPRRSHYPYDTMTQTKRTLEALALAAAEMDDPDFLRAYFEPRRSVTVGGTTYHISHVRGDGVHRFTAVPQPPVYSSSLMQKLFFLDFTRIAYPTYTIDSRSCKLEEHGD